MAVNPAVGFNQVLIPNNKPVHYLRHYILSWQVELIAREYPLYNIIPEFRYRHPHPIPAACNALETAECLGFIADVVGDYIEIGPNIANAARRQHANSHHCYYCEDPKDATRQMLAEHRLERYALSNAPHALTAAAYLTDIRNGGGAAVCRNRFEDCDAQARAAIAVHSLYNIPLPTLLRGMIRHNTEVLVGCMLFSANIALRNDNGSLLASQGTYTKRTIDGVPHVGFFFNGDACHGYYHNLENYLQYFTTAQIVVDGQAFTLELLVKKLDTQFIRICRLPNCPTGFTTLTHRLWFNQDTHVLLKTWRYSHMALDQGKRGLVSCEILVPRDFIDAILAYTGPFEKEKVTMANVYGYAKSLNNTIVVNGQDIQRSPVQIPVDFLNDVVLSAFHVSNIQKFRTSTVVDLLVQNEIATRELYRKPLYESLPLVRDVALSVFFGPRYRAAVTRLRTALAYWSDLDTFVVKLERNPAWIEYRSTALVLSVFPVVLRLLTRFFSWLARACWDALLALIRDAAPPCNLPKLLGTAPQAITALVDHAIPAPLPPWGDRRPPLLRLAERVLPSAWYNAAARVHFDHRGSVSAAEYSVLTARHGPLHFREYQPPDPLAPVAFTGIYPHFVRVELPPDDNADDDDDSNDDDPPPAAADEAQTEDSQDSEEEELLPPAASTAPRSSRLDSDSDKEEIGSEADPEPPAATTDDEDDLPTGAPVAPSLSATCQNLVRQVKEHGRVSWSDARSSHIDDSADYVLRFTPGFLQVIRSPIPEQSFDPPLALSTASVALERRFSGDEIFGATVPVATTVPSLPITAADLELCQTCVNHLHASLSANDSLYTDLRAAVFPRENDLDYAIKSYGTARFNRGSFKFFEILHILKLPPPTAWFFNGELPGGFITAASLYYGRFFSKWVANSLASGLPDSFDYVKDYPKQWLQLTKDADVTTKAGAKVLRLAVSKIPQLNFYCSDLSVDAGDLVSRLGSQPHLMPELTVIQTLHTGLNACVKVFVASSPEFLSYLAEFTCTFKNIRLLKPTSSRPFTLEAYLIGLCKLPHRIGHKDLAAARALVAGFLASHGICYLRNALLTNIPPVFDVAAWFQRHPVPVLSSTAPVAHTSATEAFREWCSYLQHEHDDCTNSIRSQHNSVITPAGIQTRILERWEKQQEFALLTLREGYYTSPNVKVEFSAFYTGTEFVTPTMVRPGVYMVEGCTAQYLSCNKHLMLMQSHRLLSAVRNTAISYQAVVHVNDGVAGAGKTRYILDRAQPGDLVLTHGTLTAKAMRAAAAEAGLNLTVKTVDSYVLNDQGTYKRVYFDEFRKVHAGMVHYVVHATKAPWVEVFGDEEQIPMYNALGAFQTHHHRFIGTSYSFNPISWTMPWDVVLGVRPVYAVRHPNNPVLTRSKQQRSLDFHHLHDNSALPRDKNWTYLTLAVEDCKALRTLGFSCNTVGSVQGERYPHVCLVRLEIKSVNDVFLSACHALVAVTRHTHTFRYYTRTVTATDYVRDIVKRGMEGSVTSSLRATAPVATLSLLSVLRRWLAEATAPYSVRNRQAFDFLNQFLEVTDGTPLMSLVRDYFFRVYIHLNAVGYFAMVAVFWPPVLLVRALRSLGAATRRFVPFLFCQFWRLLQRLLQRLRRSRPGAPPPSLSLLAILRRLFLGAWERVKGSLGYGTQRVPLRTIERRMVYSSYIPPLDERRALIVPKYLIENGGLVPGCGRLNISHGVTHMYVRPPPSPPAPLHDRVLILALLQEAYSAAFPRGTVADNVSHNIQVEISPLKVETCSMVIKADRFRRATRDDAYYRVGLFPLMHTGQPAQRFSSLIQTILAVSKRNSNVNLVSAPMDLEARAETNANKFFSTYCVSDWKNLLPTEAITLSEDTMSFYVRDLATLKLHHLEKPMHRGFPTFNTLTNDDLINYEIMIKNPPKNVAEDAAFGTYQVLQTIIHHNARCNAFFGALFKEMVKRLQAILKPEIFLAMKKNLDDLENHLNTFFPLHYVGQSFKLECDFKQFDKSQYLEVLLTIFVIYRILGMTTLIISLWERAHSRTYARNFLLGLLIILWFQRRSGSADTALGNVLTSMTSLANTFDLEDHIIAAVFQGDDSDIFASCALDTEHGIADLAKSFNLQAKIVPGKGFYFCSSFMVPDGFGWRIVPDFLKRIERLGKRYQESELETLPEVHRSLADSCQAYNDARTHAALAAQLCERYEVHYDFLPAFRAFAAVLNDYETFLSLYKARPEVHQRRSYFKRHSPMSVLAVLRELAFYLPERFAQCVRLLSLLRNGVTIFDPYFFECFQLICSTTRSSVNNLLGYLTVTGLVLAFGLYGASLYMIGYGLVRLINWYASDQPDYAMAAVPFIASRACYGYVPSVASVFWAPWIEETFKRVVPWGSLFVGAWELHFYGFHMEQFWLRILMMGVHHSAGTLPYFRGVAIHSFLNSINCTQALLMYYRSERKAIDDLALNIPLPPRPPGFPNLPWAYLPPLPEPESALPWWVFPGHLSDAGLKFVVSFRQYQWLHRFACAAPAAALTFGAWSNGVSWDVALMDIFLAPVGEECLKRRYRWFNPVLVLAEFVDTAVKDGLYTALTTRLPTGIGHYALAQLPLPVAVLAHSAFNYFKLRGATAEADRNGSVSLSTA